MLATSAEANSTEAADLPLNSTKLPPQLSENLRMFQSIHVLRSREEEELEEEGEEEEEGAEAGEEKHFSLFWGGNALMFIVSFQFVWTARTDSA